MYLHLKVHNYILRHNIYQFYWRNRGFPTLESRFPKTGIAVSFPQESSVRNDLSRRPLRSALLSVTINYSNPLIRLSRLNYSPTHSSQKPNSGTSAILWQVCCTEFCADGSSCDSASLELS